MGQKRELGMLSGCKVTGAVWKGQRDLGEEGTGRTPAPGAAAPHSSLTGVVPAREIGELHAWLSHKKICKISSCFLQPSGTVKLWDFC